MAVHAERARPVFVPAPVEAIPELRDVSDELLADEVLEFVRGNPGAGYLEIAQGLRVRLMQAVRVANSLADKGKLVDCE